LYHQMRVLIKRHDDLQAYALSGEIDKQGHQVIRPCSPDLVFHQPGDMRENIAVVEVKPANEATDGIRKDLSTLSYFVNETVRYQVGIHLIYGGRRADLNKFEGRHRELNLQRLRLYWHEAAGLAATRIL
jgi:hypothetical protein